MNEWLPEQLKTSKNLIEISQLLIETDNKHLLPTVLELLLYYVQTIVENNCVVKEADNEVQKETSSN